LASVYEQIGGKPAVSAAVDGLYERLLADPALSPYLAETDMERQKRHMRTFMAVALGGSELYADRDWRSAHAVLAVTHDAFDRVVAHTLSRRSRRSACRSRSSSRSAPSSLCYGPRS
jgi:hemoglobin